jgi:glutamyl-tRNA synthetase
LILKPDGNGKLSKRDGERLGFPVFGMDWTDPNTNTTTIGFKERGFLPEAFVNLLAMLGWNDGTDKEIFTLAELVETFSMERVHKGGAKFDYEKAKWYNGEWIKRTENEKLATLVKPYLDKENIEVHDPAYLVKVVGLVKERCQLLPDFITQSSFYFKAPSTIDTASIAPKWDAKKSLFFQELASLYNSKIEGGTITAKAAELEAEFKELVAKHELKAGDLMLPFRIMLVGGKFGPGVFEIVEAIEFKDTIARIQYSLQLLS